jgi:hypothetical protein
MFGVNPPTWRHDIDALSFEPWDRRGFCMVHRRAFRTLLRFSPSPIDCEIFFYSHEGAFHAAAQTKTLRANVAIGSNFHLTSRDIIRQMKQFAVAQASVFG